MTSSSIRPKDKIIVTPEGRIILEWDSFFERLERRIISIEDALGVVEAAPSPGLVLLTSGTVTSAAQLDLVLTSYTAYRSVKLRIENITPATDNVQFRMRFSTDAGSSYDSGASDYAVSFFETFVGGTNNNSDDTLDYVLLTSAMGNAAGEGASLEINILDRLSTTARTRCFWQAVHQAANAAIVYATGGAFRATAQDTDAIRLYFASGNIATASYALYGYA